MKLADFKIAHRLAFGFGVLVLLSLASGGLALSKLAAVQHDLDDVVNDNNVKVRINYEMAEATHVIARVIRSIVLLDDKAAMEQEMAKVHQARAAYAKAWEALQKFPASETGKAHRARILQAQEATVALNNKALELGLANKDAEATALLLKESGPATARWQAAIDENIAFQDANSRSDYEQGLVDYTQARNLLFGATALSILLAVLMGWLITRSITRQLGAEPGAAADLAASVAAGDVSRRVELEPGDSTSLMARLAEMQRSLAGVVAGVRQNADGVATASAQIAQGNQDLSQRTEEQASALEETAASMEQLSSTVRQNADNAKQANQLALGASTVAVKGGEVVDQVVTTMKGINDSSKKIADIISVIDGIACQTNILALNAAVEAARAGEQGRGFAVVASEVRSLAQRSADAAKEIKTLIGASVERVTQGTALVDQAGVTMSEIVTAIKRVTDIMGEISSASVEQSAGVAQVGEAITQMDQATQQNAALVEESAAAAESLKGQAQQLVQAVAVFKLGRDEQPYAAATVPEPAAAPRSMAPTERRGPNRAKNVSRLASKPAPKAQVAKPEYASEAPRKTGTDDEWTSF